MTQHEQRTHDIENGLDPLPTKVEVEVEKAPARSTRAIKIAAFIAIGLLAAAAIGVAAIGVAAIVAEHATLTVEEEAGSGLLVDLNGSAAEYTEYGDVLPEAYVQSAASHSAVGREEHAGGFAPNIAVFRPKRGTWHIQGLTPPGGLQYGQDGDIPVPGYYTKDDGIMDIAVFRPKKGTWHIQGKLNIEYGQDGDIPVPGHYHGCVQEGFGGSCDLLTDIAVFRPKRGTWHIQGLTPPGGIQYGQDGDWPVPGNYKGFFENEGKTDIAVFRPSTGRWYIRGQTPPGGIQFGQDGDIPVPADYRNDGGTEIAVFRPSEGTWHFLPIDGSTTEPIEYGQDGDRPVPGYYLKNGAEDSIYGGVGR